MVFPPLSSWPSKIPTTRLREPDADLEAWSVTERSTRGWMITFVLERLMVCRQQRGRYAMRKPKISLATSSFPRKRTKRGGSTYLLCCGRHFDCVDLAVCPASVMWLVLVVESVRAATESVSIVLRRLERRFRLALLDGKGMDEGGDGGIQNVIQACSVELCLDSTLSQRRACPITTRAQAHTDQHRNPNM